MKNKKQTRNKRKTGIKTASKLRGLVHVYKRIEEKNNNTVSSRRDVGGQVATRFICLSEKKERYEEQK
jgi:hypothetical protein